MTGSLPRRRYRPGIRDAKYKPEKFDPARRAWLTVGAGQMILYVYPPDPDDPETPDDPEQQSPVVRVLISRQGARPIQINMSAFTEAELDKLVEFLTLVESVVRPVVRTRDKVANDAFEEGDDSFSRIYRAVPGLVVRPGSLGADGQGVHQRPAPDADGPGRDEHPAEGVRLGGDELADGEPQGAVAEDDQPQAD